MALAVAISAQVYVARARYTHNITSYQNAVRYTNVQKQIVGQTHVAVSYTHLDVYKRQTLLIFSG